jgi:predicted nucleic acid-binding protein
VRAIVLDTSVTVAWAFRDESSARALKALELLEEGMAFAPAVWPLEVANALLASERRGRLSAAAVQRFLAMLQALPITVEQSACSTTWEAVVPLARQAGLTSYDASYLDLAMRLGLPLATLDARLGAAAEALGVQLV